MDLYLVESPFQLLQAYELIEDQKERKLILIRLNNFKRNNHQLKELVSALRLDDVVYFSTKIKLFTLVWFLPFFILAVASKRLIIGDESSFYFKLSRFFLKSRKILLLDDGVASLRKKHAVNYRRFTIFEGVGGEKNEFRHCRKLLRSNNLVKEKVNVIVGGKLVEEGICSSACYFEILQKIKADLAVSELRTVYVPHRGESEENIKEICSRFSFVAMRNSLPIELLSYEFAFYPATVSSVISTALYSMRLVYKDAVFKVYPIKCENILCRRDAILDLYQEMRKTPAFVFVCGEVYK